jgi:hypothetical protein
VAAAATGSRRCSSPASTSIRSPAKKWTASSTCGSTRRCASRRRISR